VPDPPRAPNLPRPPVAAPGRRLIVSAGVVVALSMVVGVALLSNQGGQATSGQTSPPAVAPPADDARTVPDPTQEAGAAATTGPEVPTVAPTEAQDTTVDAEAEAVAALRRQREQDLQSLSFDGQYVAQVASKSVGIVDPLQVAENGSHTFHATDILAEHLALRDGDNLGARIVLVLSTDYGHRQLYHGKPLWVTFAIGDFGSADEVQAWCESRFPQLSGDLLLNQCAVRRLEPTNE
jgi:hypothetical protein